MVAAVIRPQSLAAVALIAGAGLVWSGQSAATVAPATSTPAPAAVGSWSGKSIAIDQRVFEILETQDVVTMEYRTPDESQPMWLAQVAGFGNRTAFHPPEICYVGSHFEVFERGPIEVTAGGRPRTLMRLVIGQGEQRYEAWYWFTANGRVTPNYYQQQWWLVTDALKGRQASGTLMRLSTPMDSAEASHRRLASFLTSWESAEASHAAP